MPFMLQGMERNFWPYFGSYSLTAAGIIVAAFMAPVGIFMILAGLLWMRQIGTKGR